MKLYKLTSQRNTTQNILWGPGVTHTLPSCDDPQLCSPQVLHAYRDPTLALLLNPMHADIFKPRLWEAKGKIVVQDWDKCGVFKLTTVKRLPLPSWTQSKRLNHRVRAVFAILCVRAVLGKTKIPKWQKWADDFLVGKRITNAAAANAAAADAAAADAAAANAAARVAADVAASIAAAYAVDAAAAAYATVDATVDAAVDAAAYAAADATAYAAAHAAAHVKNINFARLARKAVELVCKESL